MPVGICEWSAGASGEALFARMGRAGLRGVQVEYQPEGFLPKMARYRDWAEKHGVVLTSVGLNLFCAEPLIAPDNAARLRAVTREAAEGAAATANRLFHVPAFGASTLRGAQELAWMTAALQAACEEAAPFGVCVASENQLSLEENRRLLQAVNRPNFTIYFDSQNPQQTPHPDAAAQASALAGRLRETHVKDCDAAGRSCPLGQGVSGAEETMRALCCGGFDGWLLLENVYEGDGAEAAMAADRRWLETVCRN